MLEIIAETFPRLIGALRRKGLSRADAAQLILAARYGTRATVWSASDCSKARAMIGAAFLSRGGRVRLSVEG
jgi:hypothetical protein